MHSNNYQHMLPGMSTHVFCGAKHLLYCSGMKMGGRIKIRLEELGWNQVDLLKRLPDLEPATLSALIKRDSQKSMYADDIASVLGVHRRWLETGKGVKLLSEPQSGLDIAQNPKISPADAAFIAEVSRQLGTRDISPKVRKALLDLMESSPPKPEKEAYGSDRVGPVNAGCDAGNGGPICSDVEGND